MYNLKNVNNTHGRVLLLVTLQAKACNFTKSNTSPWAFFTFFKLYKWYQIAQRITYEDSELSLRLFNMVSDGLARQMRLGCQEKLLYDGTFWLIWVSETCKWRCAQKVWKWVLRKLKRRMKVSWSSLLKLCTYN